MLDLPPQWLEMIQRIIKEHAPQAEVWAYGSRVTGNAYPASDIDLAFRNPYNLSMPLSGIPAIQTVFSESDLPILVDVLDWARIPESFQAAINAAHFVIQAAEPNMADPIRA